MRRWLPWCAIVLCAARLVAQGPDGFKLKVIYDRPGLPVPHWELQIEPDGRTKYVSTRSDGRQTADRAFVFSASGLARLRSALDGAHGLQPCETKTKGIARMGQKQIAYTPAGGSTLECSYNYTDNKGLATATEYLQAVTLTLDDGAELERLHRYDRLGLDPVIQQLAEFAGEGKAVELGSIRPELQSLVEDAQVLERVRTRAAQLLELAQKEDAGQRIAKE